MNKAAFLEDAKGVEEWVFGVPKCSGSVRGLPGMGGRAGPDFKDPGDRNSLRTMAPRYTSCPGVRLTGFERV